MAQGRRRDRPAGRSGRGDRVGEGNGRVARPFGWPNQTDFEANRRDGCSRRSDRIFGRPGYGSVFITRGQCKSRPDGACPANGTNVLGLQRGGRWWYSFGAATTKPYSATKPAPAVQSAGSAACPGGSASCTGAPVAISSFRQLTVCRTCWISGVYDAGRSAVDVPAQCLSG